LLALIAKDPQAFILKQGWASVSLNGDHGLKELRSLYEHLQARILEMIETLDDKVGRPRRRPHVKGGRKLDAKESRTGQAWADLSRSFGMRFDSDAPHASSPLRGMSRSLLSKTATSLRRCSAVARYLSEKDEAVIGQIVSAQREELEQEIGNLEAEAEKVAEEARELAGEVPF